VITAALLVYGFGEHRAWGDWTFVQLPSPGDLIDVTDDMARTHTVRVRHIEHRPSSKPRGFDRDPVALVVTDWQAES
jgi:hypothetical protein